MKGTRLILTAITALVAVLGLPSAAHADPEPAPVIALSCTSVSEQINCSVAITGAGPTPSIEWMGGPSPSSFQNKTTFSFRCSVGLINLPYTVSVKVERIRNQTPKAISSQDVTCDGVAFLRRIFPILCQASATVGRPNGLYFICDILWSNDGSPATVRWVSPRANRQPVVSTTDRWSTATFDCNNPGGPDLTYTAYVTVTDATGTMQTPATIPCGW
jgi:hypothetical protein